MGMFHGSGLKYADSPHVSTTDIHTSPSPPEYSLHKPVTITESKTTSNANTGKPAVPIPPKLNSKKFVKAVYDFKSEDVEDLSFKMGDLIEVLDSSDQYGWWVGKDSKGKKGNFPSNYVMEQK